MKHPPPPPPPHFFGTVLRVLLWIILYVVVFVWTPGLLLLQVNLSTFAFLFSEMVQYNHARVTALTQLHEKWVCFFYHSSTSSVLVRHIIIPVYVCQFNPQTYVSPFTILIPLPSQSSSPHSFVFFWTCVLIFKISLKFALKVSCRISEKIGNELKIWQFGDCEVNHQINIHQYCTCRYITYYVSTPNCNLAKL